MVDDPQLTLDRAGPLFDALTDLWARLELAFPAKQFAHHVVPARFSKATWARVAQRSPFVAVGFGGLEPAKENGGSYNARAVWHVFVGVQQPKPDAMLAGDVRAPGLLGMGQMVIGILHGHKLRGVGTWFCGALDNLYDDAWANDELGVIGMQATMNLQVTDERLAAALPDLLRVVTAWPNLPTMPTDTIDVRGS